MDDDLRQAGRNGRSEQPSKAQGGGSHGRARGDIVAAIYLTKHGSESVVLSTNKAETDEPHGRRSPPGDLPDPQRAPLRKYANGGIADFLRTLPQKLKIEVDDASLNRSHRNSAAICAVSSRLFPGFAATQACDCAKCRRPSPASAGVFILKTSDYAHYLAAVRPVQLRDKITSSGVDPSLPALNFGESKGRGFDHVVILPTGPMKKWLADPGTELAAQSRAKFYVALTRARHSVAIAVDWKAASLPAGFSLYEPPAF